MYDIEAAFDRQILDVRQDRPSVVFIEPLDGRVLRAVCHLTRFARPVLLASEAAVREAAAREIPDMDPSRLAFALSECAFLAPETRPDLCEEFATFLSNTWEGRGITRDLDEARVRVREPGLFGILAARLGHADIVVGGARHEPKSFFRPMTHLLATRPVVAQAGLFVLPDSHPDDMFPRNIVVFGDVGVNATMTPEVLAEVAVGTCMMARDLIPEDVLPEIRGAVVSYSNRGSDEGPSPELVRRAMEKVPAILEARAARYERYRSIRLSGEVKVSVALSRRSAEMHGNPDEACGNNVIICPNLDMGNLLYHLYGTRFPEARKCAVLFGLGSRGVDLAMDCTPEDIRLSVKATILRLARYRHWTRTPRDTFFRRYRILVMNPGSTSTKIAVYENDQEVATREILHTAEELAPFDGRPITEQFGMRKEAIVRTLADNGIDLSSIDAVSARGGLLRPIPHGTWSVNDAMCADLRSGQYGEHASNLGGLIAAELVAGTEKPAFIVDPPVVDEVPARVKVTGMKEIRRKVISHALNQIATAHRYAEEHETFYECINVVVCHMGGGITIGAHKRGRYIDVNNGLDGEGPFSPERSGGIPTGQLIDLCFSGKYDRKAMKLLNKGRGGLVDLLGTKDFREVENRFLAGEPEAVEVFEALAYQVAKHITALVPAFDGEPIDRVLLTGGLARAKPLARMIEQYVKPLGCGLSVYPGENELIALAKGALRVLHGKEEARVYSRDLPPEA